MRFPDGQAGGRQPGAHTLNPPHAVRFLGGSCPARAGCTAAPVLMLTTHFSHTTDMRSSTPFVPSGIRVKLSLPTAFWAVLKVQWALPVTCRSPLRTSWGQGSQRSLADQLHSHQGQRSPQGLEAGCEGSAGQSPAPVCGVRGRSV